MHSVHKVSRLLKQVIPGIFVLNDIEFFNCVVGFGVFVKQAVKKGDFLAEYCGDLVEYNIGDKLEDQSYVYYFCVKSNKYW